MSLRYPLIVSALAVGLGACAVTPAPPTADAASPHPLTAQGAWKLDVATAADGTTLIAAGSNYRLQFVDDRVSVLGGCNRMSGGYAVSGGTLQVQAMASTRMACVDQTLMQQDTTLARLLEAPLSMTLLETWPEQLRLKTPTGETLAFTAMPLE